ncbi:MAG: glycogen synthase [Verrucomicrobia bacterium RIFCSPLOWO2_12_FULL_64_8]|nr:MAG: glycogen synthase [Verrucomicrobia bacterium RIFCSPLOWO2_12_FULL_64_8]
MKLVQAASELYPYVKTGGLADAVGSLALTLADKGHEVAVFVPGYRAALAHKDLAHAETKLHLKIEMGDRYCAGDVRVLAANRNLTVYFIGRDEFYDRSHLYGISDHNNERDYEDNDARFIFFCKAVVEVMRVAEIQADVLHGHDWQTALLPLLLRYEERRSGRTLALKTVFTIHNIAFQGIFPMRSFGLTNLPDELLGIDGLEYYNQINLLKGGILFADRVTTVSPQYAKEIQTPEFGCGLDGVIGTRADDLVGLLNGIDPKVWNPAKDRLIPARYAAHDLTGKLACRAALLKKQGFDERYQGPVFGMVCRLTEKKGVDLLLEAKDFFLQQNCRLIVLGEGEDRYKEALADLARDHPDRIAFSARKDEAMSHLIEAGADFFLMPSLFEPCGLNQMYSQAYGTVPAVSRVGGLLDTVIDADGQPESGTGLTFKPKPGEFADALQRAVRLYADADRYAAVQRRGMARDFTWETAAVAYEQLYQDAL